MNKSNSFLGMVAKTALAAMLVWTIQIETHAQQRKPRKTKAKTAAKTVQSKPEAKTLRSNQADAADYDVSVKIENRKSSILKTVTSRVLIIVNRDKRPLTICKVILNEEYEFAGKEIKMKHSENGYVYLPIELKLGESLENIFPDDYRKTVVYVDLETDAGVRQFKIDD